MTGRREESIAARVDPAAKIIWLLLISLAGSWIVEPGKLLVITGAVICSFLFVSRAELTTAWKYRFLVFFVPTLLFIFHFGLSPLMSQEAVPSKSVKWDSLSYSLKILNSVLALTFLLSTTNVRQLVNRLASLGVPLRVAFAIYLTLRFIEILRADAISVREALRLHNRTRWLQLTRYPATLVLLGLHRAHQTASAMDLRGFPGGDKRTYFGARRWSLAGWLLPFFSSAVILTIQFWE